MFNVYPVAVRYTHTLGSGILAGMPLPCTIGVPSAAAAQNKIDELKSRNDGSIYSDFAIDYRK